MSGPQAWPDGVGRPTHRDKAAMNGARTLGVVEGSRPWIMSGPQARSDGVGGPTHRDRAAMNGARTLGVVEENRPRIMSGHRSGQAVSVDPLIAIKLR